ncbi:MAG TPA: GNAT family N-acetyltransferase [Stellaceae bacterium]|nr:GNAT family N-acetyltransferase [Stellaceae bacterium]
MPDGGGPERVRVVEALAEVPAAGWDACAGPDNPFLSHAFLEAMEASGSATDRTGWLPQHVLVEDASGRLLAAAPLYLKSHSQGEYVFDHGWAQAYERAGGNYYPKLLCAVPFTPVTGPRLLVHPEAPPDTVATLIAALIEIGRAHKVSSLHVTFPSQQDWQLLGAAGFLQRAGQQYHWENRGYASFDDFLEALNSRKRKQIRRERRDALATGIEIETLTGSALEPRHWDAFYRFYRNTVDHRWGGAYLTRGFFELLHQRLADRVVLMMARDGERYVAGALNLLGNETLFGRNWGCIGDYPFLHFEVCYYRALDFAIGRGLARVEAGAQGTHKIQRGYLPTPTYSAHWVRDRGFARAVEDFLKRERAAVAAEMAELTEELSPFRCEEG